MIRICYLFQFGGKLVSFSSVRSADPAQPVRSSVSIQKVVTETDIITHSTQLEHALHNRQFAEFCSLKIANSQSEKEETLWQFLKVCVYIDLPCGFCNVVRVLVSWSAR